MKTRALLVDDEAPARKRLRRMLEAFPNLEIVGEAGDGLSALEAIAGLKPDVVFLDIELPELSGLGVARSLGAEGPAVIFVTAYDEHALQAFEANALDYLVKPVTEARLQTAVRKALKSRSAPRADLAQALASVRPPERMALRSGARYVVFDPRKVSAILARDHYAALLIDGRELLADDSLDVLAAKLDPALFVRVHRSAVINLEFIQELEREGDRKYVALLTDAAKTRVPIARERLDELKSRLGIER